MTSRWHGADPMAVNLGGLQIDGAELESRRCLTEPLLRALRKGGYMRMAIPQQYGGGACDLVTILKRLCSLARLDSSTAWCVMVWVQGQIVLAYLPQESYERVLTEGPDILVAATSQGSGTARRDGEDYLLNGSWSFASGIGHSQWVLVHCEVRDPVSSRSAGALVGCENVEIEDVWRVLGLRATGSHRIRVEGVRVPATDFYEPHGQPCAVASIHSLLPIRPSFSLHQAAVAIGTAEGALDDVLAEHSNDPRSENAASCREAFLHFDIGTLYSNLSAAKAALLACGEAAWDLGSHGEPVDDRTASWLWATGVQSVQTACNVVLGCFRVSGQAGLFDGHTLQRRLRDALTIAQHGNVSPYRSKTLGASLLAGED